MTKYTAADFANAQFAEHEDGRLAVRSDPSDHGAQWVDGECDWHSDEVMADDGWVPVPTKPTITSSRYRFMVEGMGFDFKAGFNDALGEFGVEVIPDPEPADEELLAGIIRNIDDWQSITSPELLAKYLNTAGVTPPNAKGN